jgi:hypothetical protein
MSFAREFNEILVTTNTNKEIQDRMINNIKDAKFPGKVFVGGNRTEIFRSIILQHLEDQTDDVEVKNEIETKLPRSTSPHAPSNKVFSSDWVDRLYRTQLSRFYNQAVLEILKEYGEIECYVHHSTFEYSVTCIHVFADRNHPVDELLKNLKRYYNEGNYNTKYKLPEHPNCTHVVHPLIK